jgi:hypothetical protein
VKHAVAKTVHRRVILDIDSSESPVHSRQEGAAYNGHFECAIRLPANDVLQRLIAQAAQGKVRDF